MKVFSNQPCVQLYTGNFLDGTTSGMRGILEKHAGLCLETQAPPNAINVPAWRPMVLLPRGAHYRHEMRYALSSLVSECVGS
jgi:aldose 1-epimerase